MLSSRPSPTTIRRNSLRRAAAPERSATSFGPWTRRRLSPGGRSRRPRLRSPRPFAPYATRVGRGSRGLAEFIAELANGELIANGVHPATGVRGEIDPSEWARTGLVLDVRNGDLIEGWYGRPIGKHTVRWSAIALPAAIQRHKKTAEELTGNDWWTRQRGSPGTVAADSRTKEAYLREVRRRD